MPMHDAAPNLEAVKTRPICKKEREAIKGHGLADIGVGWASASTIRLIYAPIGRRAI